MRTLLISLAAAASTVALAAPASAQWYPPPYGYAWGYHGNYGQVRRLQVRIDQLQRQIRRLDNRDIITERERRRLMNESRDIERRLRRMARFGLHPREAYAIQNRIARLEHRIWRDANDGRRWGRYGYYGRRW